MNLMVALLSMAGLQPERGLRPPVNQGTRMKKARKAGRTRCVCGKKDKTTRFCKDHRAYVRNGVRDR